MKKFLSPKHRLKLEFDGNLYKEMEENKGVEETKKEIDAILDAMDDIADMGMKKREPKLP